MHRHSAGELEGGVVQDEEVDAAGNGDIPGVGRTLTPEGGNVDIRGRPGRAGGDASEDEGEPGAGCSQHLDGTRGQLVPTEVVHTEMIADAPRDVRCNRP